MSTGSIIIKPLEAKLERNVASFSKMNPYCVAKVGSIELRGKVCKSGGTRPVWAEAFVFSLRSNEDCFLEIKDKDMLTSDSTLGVCRIEIKELQEKGTVTKWYKLYYKKKEVGEVELEATYTEQEYTSRVIVYPQPQRVKQPEEPTQPQVDKTIKVREHIPRPEEVAPKSENVVLNSPSILTMNRPNSSTGLTRAHKESSFKSPENVTSPKDEPEVQKIEQTPVEGNLPPTTAENTQADARPSTASNKEKKKGWGLFSKIKSAFDTNNTQKKQGKKDSKSDKGELSAPLTRKADWKSTEVAAESQEGQTIEPILERKRPAPKTEVTTENEGTKFTEQENLGNIRGNYLPTEVRRNFGEQDEYISKDPYSYSQNDNDYISRLKDKYSSTERRPITDFVRRPDFQRDNLETNEKGGMTVEDLNNREGLYRSYKGASGYDDLNADSRFGNYSKTGVNDLQDRMRYKYR